MKCGTGMQRSRALEGVLNCKRHRTLRHKCSRMHAQEHTSCLPCRLVKSHVGTECNCCTFQIRALLSLIHLQAPAGQQPCRSPLARQENRSVQHLPISVLPTFFIVLIPGDKYSTIQALCSSNSATFLAWKA